MVGWLVLVGFLVFCVFCFSLYFLNVPFLIFILLLVLLLRATLIPGYLRIRETVVSVPLTV